MQGNAAVVLSIMALFIPGWRLIYHWQQMSTTVPAYHEIIDFIAAGTTPEQVINFRVAPACTAFGYRVIP